MVSSAKWWPWQTNATCVLDAACCVYKIMDTNMFWQIKVIPPCQKKNHLRRFCESNMHVMEVTSSLYNIYIESERVRERETFSCFFDNKIGSERTSLSIFWMNGCTFSSNSSFTWRSNQTSDSTLHKKIQNSHGRKSTRYANYLSASKQTRDEKRKQITNLFLTPFSFPLYIQYVFRDFSLSFEKNGHFLEFFWFFEILLAPRWWTQWKVKLLLILLG